MRTLIHLIIKFFDLVKKIFAKPIQTRREDYTEKKKLKKKVLMIERYELIDHLKSNIGKNIIVDLDNFVPFNQNQLPREDYEFKGRILDVDDDWVKLEFTPSVILNPRGPDYLYFRTELIIDFTPVEDE